jgi:hypothetical protein
MSFANLPTLAEISATRRAVPKHELRSRLDEKTTSDKDDARQLEAFRRAVVQRDRGRCRVCGCRTVKTLALDPKWREVHHLISRTNPVTRYDPRNGITVCHADHRRLTSHRLFVVGTASEMFQAGKVPKWYLNADGPLQFTEKRPA